MFISRVYDIKLAIRHDVDSRPSNHFGYGYGRELK